MLRQIRTDPNLKRVVPDIIASQKQTCTRYNESSLLTTHERLGPISRKILLSNMREQTRLK